MKKVYHAGVDLGGERQPSTNQKPLETSHSIDHGYAFRNGEKNHGGRLERGLVTKEHLQDTKFTCQVFYHLFPKPMNEY